MTSLMLTKTNTDVLEERKRPPRALQCRGEARWRPLASQRISYQAVSRNAEGSGTILPFVILWWNIRIRNFGSTQKVNPFQRATSLSMPTIFGRHPYTRS